MATIAASPPLPPPVRAALGRIDRRLRLAGLLRGLGTAGVVAAAGMAAGMAADFLRPLPIGVRLAMWAVWVAAVAVLIGRAAGRGLRPSAPMALAALAERAEPALGERLTAALGLAVEGRPPHGAPRLIAAVEAEAAAHAGAVAPARAVPLRGARRRALAGLAAVAAVATPALARPDPFATLARRFLAPWAAVDRVGRFAVAVEPGDAVLGVGSDLHVRAVVAPRLPLDRATPPGAAWLEWDEDGDGDGDEGGPTRRLAMERIDDGTRGHAFRATIPAVGRSLTYRVAAGEDASGRFRARAVEPPAVAALAATVAPPDYMKLPPAEAADPSRVEAWEGSRVTLTIAASRPLRAAAVDWPRAEGAAGPVAATLATAEGRASASATLPAEVSGDFAITLTDVDGIASRPGTPSRLVVRPDAPPTVAVRGDEGIDRTRPDDTLRVGVVARDDVAVASAELHYAIDRGEGGGVEEGHVAVRLDGEGTRSATGTGVLALAGLGLRPGDALGYRVKVLDNRPPPRGPNVAWSPSRRLEVAADAPAMATRRGQAAREALRARLDALKKAAAENRQEAELLRYAADAVARGNAPWDRDRARALEAGEAAARDVADGLRAFAAALGEAPAFRPLAAPARQAADIEAEAAREALARAGRDDDAEDRLADLRRADARLAAVSSKLDDLGRGLDALARDDADRQKLQDLADRQARLAEAEGEPAEALRARQEALRKELDALLRDNPAMKAALLDAQAEAAEALAKRARELAERQRAEAREATDLAPRADALRALAEAQRALEEDARRLALDVDLPLAENGRPRLDVEPIRRAADPIARGDLANARARLVEGESALRRLARDIDDTLTDPKALARRLVAGQDRLARDLDEALGESRSLTILPDAARAALSRSLAPLAGRQRAAADLAAAILRAPAASADRPAAATARRAAEAAAEAAGRAAAAIAEGLNPREAGRLAVEAGNALRRLDAALPDRGRREEPARRAFAEARQALDRAARGAEQALRQSADRLDADPARAAAALAGALAGPLDDVGRAADRLRDAAPETPRRLEPQRRRAEGRARALATAIRAVRARAPAVPDVPPAAVPVRGWRLLGPFDPGTPPPFDPAGPIDPEARVPGRGGDPVGWQDAPAARPDGALDLAAHYGGGPDRLAFAAAEVTRERPRRATLHVRSDDSLSVWLNGRVVYDFRGTRPLAHDEEHVSIDLAAGTNRVVAACGNAAGDWGFAISVSLAGADGFDPSEARTLRAAVAAAALGARAASDRLGQAINGETPADALAAEIAAEFAAGLDAPGDDDEARREDRRRFATALRLLQAPDALAAQAEAVRLADEAADHPDDPALARRAAEAADALALALALGDGDGDGDGKSRPVDVPPPAADALPRGADLGLDPGHAARASELARRERRIRERLLAMLAERAAPQRALREESAAIGKGLAEVRDRARALSPRADGPARAAASLLGEEAPRAMDAAADRLDGGQADPARDAQRRAAELAERGAQQADDLVKALRDDRPAADALGDESKHRNPGDALADARDAVRQAADRLEQARRDDPHAEARGQGQGQGQGEGEGEGEGEGPPDGPLAEARRAMKGAAEKLQDAADRQALGEGRGEGRGRGAEPGAPDGTATAAADAGPAAEPNGKGAGAAAASSLGALQEMLRGRKGRAWGELPGHLRTEILQMSQGRYRDDYARLIELYFREIAGAGAPEDAGPRP